MGHNHEHNSGRVLGFAFVLNLSFALIEFVGGWMTNSIAIISDAVHDLGDSFALALTWYFEKKSLKQRDETYTYGYRRWSVLAALISSGVLLVGSTLIVTEAIPRLWQAPEVHTPGMIGLAILGVFINGLAFFRLQSQISPGERAVRWHLLEDILGWVAVLIGSVVMYFTNWYWLDPVLSIGVALFILWGVFKNVRSFSRILLQAVPEDIDIHRLSSDIKAVSGVVDVHDLHLWTLDSNKHVLSLHVVIANQTSILELQEIKQAVKTAIGNHKIAHDTLEIEFLNEDCSLESC